MIHATLHQLKVFEAAARNGSFTKAAEELYITQPTVSTQIKQLTRTVGLPLFEQIGKRLYLTEAGEYLLITCQEIFERLDNFGMTVQDLKGTKQGRLRLACVTTAQYFIPKILGKFCQQYPGIDIALEITNHEQLEKRILDNEDDLYIFSHPPDDLDLHAEIFLDNPLVVIARGDHPLVGKKEIPLQALENEPFIMREIGSGTRRSAQNLFAQKGITVPVRLEISNNEAIKQAIAGGLGISILSEHVLDRGSLAGEYHILDVQYFPIVNHWYICHLKSKKLSVSARAFFEYLTRDIEKVSSLSSNSKLTEGISHPENICQ